MGRGGGSTREKAMIKVGEDNVSLSIRYRAYEIDIQKEMNIKERTLKTSLQ